MPTDLLLPAFALTLLANAALVVVAVRGLVRGRAERDRQSMAMQLRIERGAGPATADAIGPIARTTPPATSSETGVDAPVEAPAKPARRARSTAPRSAAAAGDPETTEARRRRAEARAESRTNPGGRERPARGDRPRPEVVRGGRRRFSLPNLDQDHERVNRSIETFLAGGDPGDPLEAVADPLTAATTVAIVAIDGLDAEASPADQESLDHVLATVERSIRGAARSADRVTAAGNGRFRVVLPATGELAARAYLRRVRATVGPSLEAADAPLDLVTATATVLDDPVRVAVVQAEARLDAALASAARRASGDAPRVAAD